MRVMNLICIVWFGIGTLLFAQTQSETTDQCSAAHAEKEKDCDHSNKKES